MNGSILATRPLDLEEYAEWNGFDDEFTQYWGDDNESAQTLILTTLSPLLTVNDRGHPEARFPECELAEMLKLDVSKLKLSHSYTRTELVGGVLFSFAATSAAGARHRRRQRF